MPTNPLKPLIHRIGKVRGRMTLSQKTSQIGEIYSTPSREVGCHQMRAAVTLRRRNLDTAYPARNGGIFMQRSGKQAFIIAGTGSGCGKTTVTLGILRALMARGLSVQPSLRSGQITWIPAGHSAVSGVTSRNLDAFMLPPATLNGLRAPAHAPC